MHVFHLLLRDLDLFEDGGDLVVRQKALLLARFDQACQLLDIGERVLDRQHSVAPIPHLPVGMAPRRHAARSDLPALPHWLSVEPEVPGSIGGPIASANCAKRNLPKSAGNSRPTAEIRV